MTQPKEKGGVPPIEIYTIPGRDPVQEQDAKNEDDEFKRIEDEQFRLKELEKVRNLTRWP
jgi:hypothetical protein